MGCMSEKTTIDQAGRVSREEELAWAATTAAGRTAAAELASLDTAEHRTLTGRTLARQVAAGRRAEGEFVAAFEGMAAQVARRFSGRGVDTEDLAQEARLRLVQLTRSFKPELGNRFSSYATAALDGCMRDTIRATGRTIDLPKDVHDELARLARVRDDLAARLGRDATPRELALALGCDESRVAQMEQWAAPVGTITEAMEDTLADPAADEVDSALSAEDAVRAMLAPVTGRAREVMELRFGLSGGMPLSQAEVARVLGISQPTVHHAEQRAYKAIRAAAAAAVPGS